jgi:hypothetical protein
MGMNPDGNKTGSFGTVTYAGATLNIEINPHTLGGIALTSGDDRIECYFDGTQWVCNSIDFGPTPSTPSSKK